MQQPTKEKKDVYSCAHQQEERGSEGERGRAGEVRKCVHILIIKVHEKVSGGES